MRGAGDVLLVSTYELGHPPHGLALAAAFLERAGFSPACLDLAVATLDLERARRARLVVFSVPMHTALRLALGAAARVRAAAPGARLAFHGLYAPLHADALVRAGAVAVLGGEAEESLVALARALEAGEPPGDRFVHRGGGAAVRARLDFPVPSRAGLPPLERYGRLVGADGLERLAGYTEATRGCKHHCRHCPIPPVYGGRFFAVPLEVVLADVAQQVAAGARHVTFGDPDFLNGPTHALRLARAFAARFPGVSFDFTAKVEHLVAHAARLPELAAAGAVLVTTAVESFEERVLAALGKGHGRADVDRALEACAAAGLAVRPTFVPFTPWSTLDEVIALAGWLEDHAATCAVDPVQLSIRLLVPPGSSLEGAAGVDFGPLDEAALTWRWRHPDPRMDALQLRLAAAAEDGAARGEPAAETLARMRALALAAAGRPHVHVERPRVDPRRVPRLTETWFC